MDASKIYETPTLTVVGSFETLTQGQSDGSHFDSTHLEGQDAVHNIFS